MFCWTMIIQECNWSVIVHSKIIDAIIFFFDGKSAKSRYPRFLEVLQLQYTIVIKMKLRNNTSYQFYFLLYDELH